MRVLLPFRIGRLSSSSSLKKGLLTRKVFLKVIFPIFHFSCFSKWWKKIAKTVWVWMGETIFIQSTFYRYFAKKRYMHLSHMLRQKVNSLTEEGTQKTKGKTTFYRQTLICSNLLAVKKPQKSLQNFGKNHRLLFYLTRKSSSRTK